MNSAWLATYFPKRLPRNVQVTFLRALRTVRPLQSKNHYNTLNLDKSCSDKEIRDAYIKLSKEFHPDKNPNEQKHGNRFVEINEAYSVLSKPDSRKYYDQSLLRSEQPEWKQESYYNPSSRRKSYYDANFCNNYYQEYYRPHTRKGPYPTYPNRIPRGVLRRLILSAMIAAFLVGIFRIKLAQSGVPEPHMVVEGVPVFMSRNPYMSHWTEEQVDRHNSQKRAIVERTVRNMAAEKDMRERENERLRFSVMNNPYRRIVTRREPERTRDDDPADATT